MLAEYSPISRRETSLIAETESRVENRLEVLNWRLKAASRINDVRRASSHSETGSSGYR